MADYRIVKSKVQNPMTRRFDPTPYRACCYCHNFYTALGLPRHWDHCVQNPNRPKRSKK